jgi:hypothetical protein
VVAEINTAMNDEQGNTPQDRRTVALSEEHERRYFVEQFVSDYPGTSAADVVGVLDKAAASIAPSESRDKLDAAVKQALGITAE